MIVESFSESKVEIIVGVIRAMSWRRGVGNVNRDRQGSSIVIGVVKLCMS